MSKNDNGKSKGGKDSESSGNASKEASQKTSNESDTNTSRSSENASKSDLGANSKQSDKQDSSQDQDSIDNQAQRDKALDAIAKGENLGDYGTRETIGMVESAFNARQSEINANKAWSQGNILEAAKHKLSQLGSEVSHTVQENYNELTNAPMDYAADVMRDPMVTALSLSNPITATLNLGTRLTDNVMDYFQEEATFKEAGTQALSDLGMVNPTLGFAGDMIQDPQKAIVNRATSNFGLFTPIVRSFVNEAIDGTSVNSNPTKQSYSNVQFNKHLGKDGLSQRLVQGNAIDDSLLFAVEPIQQTKQAADTALVQRQMNDMQKGIQSKLFNPQIILGTEPEQPKPNTQQSLLSFM